MTSTHPAGRPVDIDLLADYLEGVLPAAAVTTVDALLTSDPAWAAALAALTAAQPRVTAALSDLAARTGPMPADVADRLDAALRPPPPGVIDLAAARRERRSRVVHSGWIKFAAVFVLVLLGVGGAVKLATNTDTSKSSSTRSSAAGGAAPLLSQPSATNLRLIASGTDYQTLTGVGSRPAPMHSAALNGPNAIASQSLPERSVPSSLRRLLRTSDLNACLRVIESTVGGTATTVDFASYRHQPALVVTLTGPAATIAVGPACGQSGTDELARG